MRIAIDGYDLTRQSTGVGRYLRNLLPEIIKADSRNRYHVFLREDIDLFNQFANFEKTIIPDVGSYTLWQNGALRKALRGGGYGLLFAASNQLPFFYGGKSILVIHDVAWRAIAKDFSFKERTGKDWKCRWSLKRAERIYTDAEFTKRELIHYYQVPEAKIQAIPLAIETSFKRETNVKIDAFKLQYGLTGKKTIGFLGSIFGRRHIRELIQAFGQLRDKHNLALIIVGKNFLGKEITDLLHRDGVIWLEWLPEEQLNSFYSALDMFAYISAYEGFGFPPLEALACGTVSLLLPTSSLREIYHNLALFVDSPEPALIAAAIEKFLKNQLPVTAGIMAAWQNKKNYFSWPRVAADYLKNIF